MKQVLRKINREAGVNPARSRHCDSETLQMPLGNREGGKVDDLKPGELPVL